jgi:UDP-N-acetylmuramoyl-L-alanyl-D-glutamate--2,6-diaminopimelate ligase
MCKAHKRNATRNGIFMMHLTELCSRAAIQVPKNSDINITGIATDSRAVERGALFVAIDGVSVDGAIYIADAIRGGAACVISETKQTALPVPHIQVQDARAVASALAAIFYTPQPEYVVAVTGTDGKTSVAEFTRQLASLCGKRAASMGTLGLRSPEDALNQNFPANNTSPGPVLLHQTMQALAQHNVPYIAMEASSHGIHQKRMDGVKFTAAAFTNITRDHLDYHGTDANYFAAKARLFNTLLPEGAAMVVNADDARVGELRAVAESRNVAWHDFGHTAERYRIKNMTPTASGISAEIVLEGELHRVTLPLYGAFQLYNVLAAYGLLRCCNIASETLLPQLEKIQGVRGRLERVALHSNGAVMFVDYAHTPAALESTLKSLRAHCSGKLHVVFGCGGDRDTGKRPLMGEVADRLADVVIITDDNPRTEDPETIRQDIQNGAQDATIIGDREQAITHAVQQLGAGDVLVVAGKGHEEYQIIGEQRHYFDDAEVIRKTVETL